MSKLGELKLRLFISPKYLQRFSDDVTIWFDPIARLNVTTMLILYVRPSTGVRELLGTTRFVPNEHPASPSMSHDSIKQQEHRENKKQTVIEVVRKMIAAKL